MVNVDVELDCKGMYCPMPIVKLKKATKIMTILKLQFAFLGHLAINIMKDGCQIINKIQIIILNL